MKAILRGAASSPAHDHFLNAYETGLRVTPQLLNRIVWNQMERLEQVTYCLQGRAAGGPGSSAPQVQRKER